MGSKLILSLNKQPSFLFSIWQVFWINLIYCTHKLIFWYQNHNSYIQSAAEGNGFKECWKIWPLTEFLWRLIHVYCFMRSIFLLAVNFYKTLISEVILRMWLKRSEIADVMYNYLKIRTCFILTTQPHIGGQCSDLVSTSLHQVVFRLPSNQFCFISEQKKKWRFYSTKI